MSIRQLLQKAELTIHSFAIHERRSMATYRRVRPHYVMSYLKKGHAEVRIGDTLYHAGPGSVTLLPPFIPHDHFIASHEECTFLWWHFTYQVGDAVDVLKFMNVPAVSELRKTGAFEEKFTRYMALQASDTAAEVVRSKALALDMFADLIEQILPIRTPADLGVPSPFLDMLTEILNTEDRNGMSLQKLSDTFHLNPTYISNRFREYFGITPIALFHTMLTRRAKDLMTGNALTLSEVADRLGFTDLSSFSRFYRDRTGEAPSQFFKRNTGSL